MHDARAGFQRAEEIDGMVRRVAEEKGYGFVAAIAGAKEGTCCDLDLVFEHGIADRPVAELNGGARAVVAGRLRQQVGQRDAFDRIVPADALRIILFAGMGHECLWEDEKWSFRERTRNDLIEMRALKPPSTARRARRSCRPRPQGA